MVYLGLLLLKITVKIGELLKEIKHYRILKQMSLFSKANY